MNSGASPNPAKFTPIADSQGGSLRPSGSRFAQLYRTPIALAALVALWAVIYLSGLSHPALLDDVDTVHAEAAREMVLRHDWVTLYANGVRYLEKAPLMYWSVAPATHFSA
jgi:4-amino-4-deoxy-L-arabinose transferase and related glycosyltransferases of PMT family